MPRPRWIVPWADSETKPAIYHCISRVVDQRFAFTPTDKEQFRIYMRMMENFSGCRVLAYCVMSNHFHLMLEVPPKPKIPLTDSELLKRLSALYTKPQVASIAKELAAAREVIAKGLATNPEAYIQAIHARFTYRMHDLSEFMKTLLQRFTRWHNTRIDRKGNLWEENFKSIIVEDGLASRTIAAYIDLNPVRAGIVKDPAEYRWSSYGEAMGATGKNTGAKARGGLVRAIMADKGWKADARHWPGRVAREYRMLLLEEGTETTRETFDQQGNPRTETIRKGIDPQKASTEIEALTQKRDTSLRQLLKWRTRYFTDGAVIGSREFVDNFFNQCRNRFGPKRKSGARKMRGNTLTTQTVPLWTIRDLKKNL